MVDRLGRWSRLLVALAGHILAGMGCIHMGDWADPWYRRNSTKVGHDVEKTDRRMCAKLEVAVKSALVAVVFPEDTKTLVVLVLRRSAAAAVVAIQIGNVESSEACCGCCRHVEERMMSPCQMIALVPSMATMARRTEDAMLVPIQAAELHL